MEFGTSIHCMDGRIQQPLLNFLKRKYNLKYIDTITEPGPCKIISENLNTPLIESIENRISISLNKHGSKIIFISGHYDCAGNPISKDMQIQQIEKCEEVLRFKYPNVKVIKLWINKNWEVEEL